MASPNSSYDDIITTTLHSRTKKLADNVLDSVAILKELKKAGRVKYASGGDVILQELEYDGNGTYTRYSGYETLDISPSATFTAASFDWKQCAVSVSISGLEMVKNSGKEQMIDLLESRIRTAEKTMMNNLAADLYSDGTAANQIGGLQSLVADTPTSGTVGGIDRSTYTWWRNTSYDATTDGGAAATTSNIQTYMNHVWCSVTRGADHPKMILADTNYFKLFWGSLQAIQRITSAETANAGFRTLEFNGVPVYLDGGYGGNAPTNHMYFLNTDYIHFRPAKDRNMKVLDDRFSTNQDALVKLIVWAGNLTLSNAFTQGVLKD